MDKNLLKNIDTLIEAGLQEDVLTGDITTNTLIPASVQSTAVMIAKADGVIAGLFVAEAVFKKLDNQIEFIAEVSEGDKVKKGDLICTIKGSYRALLTGERLALNFLQRISGIASETAKYVEAVKETKTLILDTRKTVPGLRLLDKYAVKAGGGTNHRMGLFDMVMIKDNHISAAGGITNAVKAIRPAISPEIKIEVETTNLDEVKEALDAKADIIMLDNMDNETMKKAVRLIDGKAKVEASGNMNLERVKEVAATGVDYISIGALTHSVNALDISMKFK
ncbi:MAG TPA: carboxylating nicotinate-nucleotide diphosphorylase [Prolixibacteraceae bacterium]|nr:carboxylating nicotinate-nucleotide diphosphorylase [Prolixibacteraceae bacterium]HPS12380.1 carboxylating nicotinate-nucleotide diphosphorylase [Prolixibacteraceae bacterium]